MLLLLLLLVLLRVLLLLLLLLLSTFSNQIVRNDCPSDTSLGQGIAFASAFASAFAFASALESDSESGPLTDCNIISHTYVGLAWANRLSSLWTLVSFLLCPVRVQFVSQFISIGLRL